MAAEAPGGRLTDRALGGTLRATDAGREVTLAGWVHRRRDHGGLIFIDLRDRGGIVQLVLEGSELAHSLRGEDVLAVRGSVVERDPAQRNPRLPTGEVEVHVATLDVLNRAETPPFPVDDDEDADEALRLRYRYVDLRRPAVQQRLRLRAKMVAAIRASLEAEDFAEVETPILSRSTPEGARDFLVPSRLQRGRFFALPQSPQLFKQLMMVAGWERYYQIARCFRDEDLRADRQLEFTQLDLEMSFVAEEDVLGVTERMLAAVWRTLGRAEPALPLRRLPYADAMLRFGSDKPDTRLGLEIADVTEAVAASEFKVFASADGVRGLAVPSTFPRSRLDELTEQARALGAGGLVWLVVEEGGDLRGPVAKFLSHDERRALVDGLGGTPGSTLLLVADRPQTCAKVLGALRLALGEELGLVDHSVDDLLWITEFPMFERGEDGTLSPLHHPFTSPVAEDLDLLESAPERARSRAYDVVFNGVELGGGSIRIHDRTVQQRVFAALGIGEDEAQDKFGFLLEALRSGAPPHGGIALGIDRMAMLLAGAPSIREVIAFPVTQSGTSPLTGAPSAVEETQLRDLGLRLATPPKPSAP